MSTLNIYPRLIDFTLDQLLDVSAMINVNLKEFDNVYTQEQKENFIAFRIQLLTAARIVAENERIAKN